MSDRGFPESLQPQPTTNAERVNSLHKAHPVAAPGTEFHYFNPNYDVLARVVEVVSGQPFSDYLRSHLWLRQTVPSDVGCHAVVKPLRGIGFHQWHNASSLLI
ncbi:serine hydrolase [Cyanobacteria bacterium FACHB-471]|nr:serine hydrolase [Cyanobacteria bacterium FACHB-471]